MRTAILLVLALSMSASACGGKKPVADPTPEETTALDEPADLDAVTSAQLDNEPCGNPDWSRLPDGTKPPNEPPTEPQ